MKSEAIHPCTQNRRRARRQAAGTTVGDSSVESPVNYEKEVAMELKKLSRKGLLLVFMSVLLLSVTKQSNAQTICSNQTGTNNGFFYSFWKDTGSACMTLGSGGNYDVRRPVKIK